MNQPDRTQTYQPEATEPLAEDGVFASPRLQIGRYRVESILGQGGFGLVYLAHDDQLLRPVAIKVPHRKLVAGSEGAEAYLAEARMVANLDHPNIVPVHDVGTTEDGLPFVVSKFIEGSNLSNNIREQRLSPAEVAHLIATVAEALHYAHRKGVVHRDIKPANILIDNHAMPYVADFGLALKEENVGKGPRFAGTPSYMSPEQARGEGHRVDGRSDIFSLGVVFYELLVGLKPFRGDSQSEVLEQITTYEPRPLRQIDEAVPKELERICFKAMSKRAANRYMTAKDMADDLRHYLAGQTTNQTTAKSHKDGLSSSAESESQPPSATPGSSGSATPSTPISRDQGWRVVPKGLRSFDAQDAEFFLDLLPGPRDREGFPESIRFWKTCIEETDPENTFSVGLIYGPSGCGKSSLVKAGLLPRLSTSVIKVYLEATGEEAETRLMAGLRKRCPALPANLDAIEMLAELRRGQALPPGTKILIVLDQFEQWLHSKKAEHHSNLVQALRQCDGGRVQCIIMVRDDFWMAVTRFLNELEVELVQGQNCAAVDLFDMDHSKKVLADFGRAFGKLSDSVQTKEQTEFLNLAVAGLAQEGKIVCVRLALFAEMMKGRPWDPSSLKMVGGTEGVGVTFLEETFSAPSANPKHRFHQKAARAVLAALLPESGADIKGYSRSYAHLQAVSGYAGRPKEFDALIHILDREIRLITPTERSGSVGDQDTWSKDDEGQKHYQLSHDYLVHSLRDWLTRKLKETRRGRAELLLEDRAAVWNARPENRQLPSLLQWIEIHLQTQTRNWTQGQHLMMAKAKQYYAIRGLLLAIGVMVLFFVGWEGYGRNMARELRGRLLVANTQDVPGIVAEMAPYRRWINPLLRDAYHQAARNKEADKQLRASLALLPEDPSQVDFLTTRLLDAQPQEVRVLRSSLLPYKQQLLNNLWAAAEQPSKGHEQQRLRAACALAKFDPKCPRWSGVYDQVANDLVAAPPMHLATWMELLRPMSAQLQAPLATVFRATDRRITERSIAADILADYSADQPEFLIDLLMDADENQFAVLFTKIKANDEQAIPLLIGEVEKSLMAVVDETACERLAKRQANAAVALLRLNRPASIWDLLKHRSDNRVRSYLIHRFGPLGAEATTLVDQFYQQQDISIQRALMLSLGEFAAKEWPPEERNRIIGRMRTLYQTSNDPGLHAAAEWLLQQWNQATWLRHQDQEWALDKANRDKKLERIRQETVLERGSRARQWYVNGQGQTMVVLPGPVVFLMGSPIAETGHFDNELLHNRRIGRTFAIASKPVTLEQFLRFRQDYRNDKLFVARYAPTDDCPVHGITWYLAADYCNWLSKIEGIPEQEWCYEPNKEGKYEEGMRLAPDYLKRTGYRLPTEAEWEYACRAESTTSRYFGESEDLLGKYAWYVINSSQSGVGNRSWPVGSLKPNDFGLFDMHGQVWCWCQGLFKEYPATQKGIIGEDTEDPLEVNGQDHRVMRGGSFDFIAGDERSANRHRNVPKDHDFNYGFRPVRTIR